MTKSAIFLLGNELKKKELFIYRWKVGVIIKIMNMNGEV